MEYEKTLELTRKLLAEVRNRQIETIRLEKKRLESQQRKISNIEKFVLGFMKNKEQPEKTNFKTPNIFSDKNQILTPKDSTLAPKRNVYKTKT